MNTATLLLLIGTVALTAGCIVLNKVTAEKPKLNRFIKKTTAAIIPLSLAGSVLTAPDFYTARPALLAYMAAPVLVGIIWTLYRIETASPGRITGLVRGNQRRRTTGSQRRQPRIVPKFLPSLRGWLTLALFEDVIKWRVIHVASLAIAWLTAAALPAPPAYIAPWLITMVTTTRWMKVQGARNKIIQRVYAISASHLDYAKAVSSRLTSGGAQFASATGSIHVEWTDLTTPNAISIAFPVTFAKTDLNKRTTFENEFDATLPGAGWRFDWDTTATTVNITVASYPAVVRWEMRTPDGWSKFYIGDKLDDGSPADFNVESESPHILIAGETGSGKMLELSTAIPTPSGWKKFGNIHPGDEVFGPDGQPVRVVFETQPTLTDEYEVVFSDGAIILASADHLWYTETREARKARSKQKGNYKNAQRRTRLHPDVTKRLRADAAKAGPADVVTALDAAMLAGINETVPWYRDVLAGLPILGMVQEVRDFQYAEQVVKQEQTVLRYPTQDALAAFARSWSIKGEARERLDRAIADVTLGPLSASDIAALLGIDIKTARRRLWGSGVKGVESREAVALTVSGKTVTRKGRTAAAYPKVDLFLALAEAGDVITHDQRESMATGAVRTTAQIMQTLLASDGALNHSIPVAAALEYPEADLPVPPYTLGVWLGDGFTGANRFCGMDHQVARNVEQDGYVLGEVIPPAAQRGEKHPDYREWTLRQGPAVRPVGVDPATKKKHVPELYLRASVDQRRALLAGLLDTDGTVAPQGTVQFTNTNEALARGAHALALGLGYRATIREGRSRLNGKDYGPSWTVSFTTRDEVFRLDRKNRTLRERTTTYNPEKNENRYIVDVRPTGRQSLMKCIQVDSEDHLYLAGEHLIATHNTEAMFVVAAQALQKGWQLAICDPKETGWAMWTRRRRPTNENGHDTGADKLRDGDARPGVIEHAIEVYGIRDVLVRCKEEMQRRKKVNGAHKVVKWTELPEDVKEKENIKPLLVIVDEALSLFDMKKGATDDIKAENEVRGEALSVLQTLIVEARALGIHVLLGIQRPDAAVLGGAMRSNLGARVACGVMEPTGYQMMFNVTGGVPRLVVNNAEGKKVIGRALVRSSPGQPIIPVQVAWLGPGQQDLNEIAPLPPDPDVEDETPSGPFNPYAQMEDPTPWLNQQFGEAAPARPPWEESEDAGAPAAPGAALWEAAEPAADVSAQPSATNSAPPWEQALAPEAPPWEQALAPEAPPWEQAQAPETPPWESAAAAPQSASWDTAASSHPSAADGGANPYLAQPGTADARWASLDDLDEDEDEGFDALDALMSSAPSSSREPDEPARPPRRVQRPAGPAMSGMPAAAPAAPSDPWLAPTPTWEAAPAGAMPVAPAPGKTPVAEATQEGKPEDDWWD